MTVAVRKHTQVFLVKPISIDGLSSAYHTGPAAIGVISREF
jgi:hypothetical protein